MQSTCESVPICVEPVSEHQRSDQRRKKTIGYHSCGRKTVYLSSFLGNAHLQTLSNHTQTPTCIAHNATCPTNTYKNGNRVCISFGTGQWIHSMLCLVIPQNLVSCCRDDDDVVGDAATRHQDKQQNANAPHIGRDTTVCICAKPVSEHQRSDQRRKKTIGYHSCGRKTVYLSSFLGNAHLQTLSNHTQTPTCIAHNATCPTNTYKNGNRVCISFGIGQWWMVS